MTIADAPVLIVEYDATWPQQFEDERDCLARVLKAWIAGSIEHVGSTAVAGLAAKPVIDIMAGVESLDASRPAIAALEQAGYCYAPYRPDEVHWFCKPSPAFRTHHLHLVPQGTKTWRDSLTFRDYLREHSEVAAEYAALKYELAEKHRTNREAYTDAKTEFVTRVLGLARGG